jgi:predicted nucleic acid-binding protein
MEITGDASIFLSVVLNETDRDWIVHKTRGADIAAPEILPYEIGNALIAMNRKGRLTRRELLQAFDLSQKIRVKLVSVNIADAMKIAQRFNLYAYDAYYLQCCLEKRLPLMSLDHQMQSAAEKLNIEIVR